MAVDSQFGHAIISPINISDAQNISDPMERLIVSRILIETDSEHDSPCSFFRFRTTLELNHQAAITIKKSCNVCKIEVGSTSHGITLLFYHKYMIENEDRNSKTFFIIF